MSKKRVRSSVLTAAAIMSISAVFYGCGEESSAPAANIPEAADTEIITSAENKTEEISAAESTVSENIHGTEPEKQTAEENIPAETVSENIFPEETAVTEETAAEEAPPAFDPVSAYAKVLGNITAQFADPDPENITDNWLFESMTYNAPAAENTGYLYYDINGDGKEELIICGADDGDGNIYAVYTWNDGNIYHIVDGWSRNRYSITADGKILNSGSAGAAYSCFGVYRINESCDDLECEDFFFTDYIDENEDKIGIYHNTSGEWDKSVSELTDENADLFYDIGGEYELMTPAPTAFTDMVNAQIAKTAHLSISGVDDTDVPDDYTEFNTGIIDYGVRIMISSDKNANVILTALELTDDYTVFNAAELFEADITPEKPVLTTVDFPGTIPSYGIEVTDETGTRFYSIDISGEDGSLMLSRINVGYVDHSRG